ncbi:L-fuculose phosphate aldolase [Pseudooceanicola marinus]|uniref:L-fuculose phosphate aldolase n=1 Tax=Pseudooceanicola marinus TaxID=396013 RepID=A0A1X6YGN4_9RHOB|nr:class II aldolase/adducin family protein [Pseudooceanicola marinus]PJE26469.1 class II aldolase [Pseudooceanicola marinus]SLN21149.1 L-fuculose phosphate aldolase [Pseudooceanicola marinus]
MTEDDIRTALIEASRACIAQGLSNATAGNISIRFGAGMMITPSGIPPEEMRPEMMVPCTFDGTWQGHWKPSSEWALHAALYAARPRAQAVVHAHPTHCVALSCLRKPIPAFHYMIAGFGGEEIPCARYETFGSAALARSVAATLGHRYHACLMANHGMIALGPDLATALTRTGKLEALAQQYLLASSVGTPVLLPSEEMARVAEAYENYGYEAAPSATS